MKNPAQHSPGPGPAELYERSLVGPLFRPFAEELLLRAAFTAGNRLLDVACGTGIVARLARASAGNQSPIVGVDMNPGMLAVARSLEPTIEWREGEAARLPVSRDEVFDAVSCHQGLQFFKDRSAAVSEMHRVLRPGGRLALGTWRALEENDLIRDLHRVAERHLGPIIDTRHCLGDADAIRRLLAGAGFVEIRMETVARTVHFTDGNTFVQLNASALVGRSERSRQMSGTERGRLVAVIAEESAHVLDRGQLTFDMRCNIATAQAG